MRSEQEIRDKIKELEKLKEKHHSNGLWDITRRVEIDQSIHDLKWVLNEE